MVKWLNDDKVMERYDISAMTLHRWRADARLGFPQPVKMRNRNKTLESELDAYDARMAAIGRRAAQTTAA